MRARTYIKTMETKKNMIVDARSDSTNQTPKNKTRQNKYPTIGGFAHSIWNEGKHEQ